MQDIRAVELRAPMLNNLRLDPYAHYTLHEDDSVSVIAQGMPLCVPTTLERARKVALSNGLGDYLPVWDARFGQFGIAWPRN